MRIRRLLISSIVVAGCGGSDYADYFLPTGAARSSSTAATSTTTGRTDGGADASGAGGAQVDAGSVCREAATWTNGKDYKSGTSVRAVCMNPGGGLTVCEVGITYLWICKDGSACATYAPGVDGWWGAWTLGMRCS